MALWRLDGLGQAGIEDPVAALVLGAPRPVDLLLVGGRAIVQASELRTADEAGIAADIERQSRRLLQRVEATLPPPALSRGADPPRGGTPWA